VLFFQHFRGGMDNWDPAVTDGLAASRPVILYNYAGVGASGGETPETIEELADNAAAFLDAIKVSRVDVLGFSIGGYVAQAFVLRHPELVRKLVLVGTGPRAGITEGTHPDYLEVATHEIPTLEDFLFLFFAPSETSQAAGKAFWERRHQRTEDADPPSSQQAMKAQLAAAREWRGQRGERYSELKRIKQPTLVVNGHSDIMIPTINSYTLSQHIPNAQLIIYPDSGHAAHFQYPELFVSHTTQFLDARE
jgi:pimeloyl-ACP methyl ester carboxylesterase